jgi:hypothetical protein
VVVRVTGRVDHLVLVVANLDGVAVVENVSLPRVSAVGIAVRVERVENGVESVDVVGVAVGDHDLIDVVYVLADDIDDALHRARVHERHHLAVDQIGICGEYVCVRRDVADHDGRYSRNRLEAGSVCYHTARYEKFFTVNC